MPQPTQKGTPSSRTARRRRWLDWGVSSLAALAVAGCGGGSPTQPTPPPPALGLTCPADQTVASPDGQATVVTYTPATPQGGTPPVTVVCTPASDTPFPVGQTTVTCAASDTRFQTASCTFSVRVQPPLRATRIVAFGDSITWGEDGLPPSAPSAVPTVRPLVRVTDPYPALLEAALDLRYPFQSDQIVVFNEGVGGEATTEGLKRLPGVLASRQAQAVLILEGANDINGYEEAGIPLAAANLNAMAAVATRAGVKVYLATLPPWNPEGFRGHRAALVPELNAAIARVAVRRGVELVDLYAAFGGDLTLIAPDGLHPNQAGYQRMADTFFEAITRTLEVAPDAPSSGSTGFALRRRR